MEKDPPDRTVIRSLWQQGREGMAWRGLRQGEVARMSTGGEVSGRAEWAEGREGKEQVSVTCPATSPLLRED